jgi:hypothetical protein
MKSLASVTSLILWNRQTAAAWSTRARPQAPHSRPTRLPHNDSLHGGGRRRCQRVLRDRVDTCAALHMTFTPSSSYGRGAEIWPPGSEEAIRLQDSFPNGMVPDFDQTAPTTASLANVPSKIASRRLWVRAMIPWIIGLLIPLCWKCLRPLDVLLTSFLSGYIVLLARLSSMTRWSDNFGGSAAAAAQPMLPALPPQGHVPRSVSYPLGYRLSQSWAYSAWVTSGVLLGLVAPLAMLLATTVTSSWSGGGGYETDLLLEYTVRPLFLLVCQVGTENIVSSRSNNPLPLPIRIFVPVAYNTMRLGYLWQWALAPYSTAAAAATIGYRWWLRWAMQTVAVANLVYWTINLFGFLLPIAVIRYMRAHFLAVEASQVTVHSGLDSLL